MCIMPITGVKIPRHEWEKIAKAMKHGPSPSGMEMSSRS